MATKRIKDITNTAASVASDAYLAIDGTSNGTEKITRDNFRQDTADAFVAAPGTYNLAPLSGGAVEVAKGGTGATTAAGARTNLSVNSIDEDAQANALKVTAPALYFNGTASVIEVADDDKFSFTDGTDDLPFSGSGWVKTSDITNMVIASKYGTSSATREYLFYVDASDQLTLLLYDGTLTTKIVSDTALTAYEGDWVHLAFTYGGAGPNSDSAFSANMSGGNAALYVNGQAVSATATDNASYTGMVNTTKAVWIGRYSSVYSKGSIRDVKIFNRELTATEVAELAKGNDLGFADEWAGSLGGVYTSDFSAGVDGWSTTNGTAAGNIDTIGGQDDNLRLTIDTTNGAHIAFKSVAGASRGKRYRMTADIYIPSTNSHVDGVQTSWDGVNQINYASPTLDTWFRIESEHTVTLATNILRINALDGGSTTVNDAAGDDVLYIRNVKISQLGTLADFRSERFDSSTGKWYDLSDNAFVGTNTGATLVGREVPVYETGSWTPSITFGGGSTGVTYGLQEGYYTRIGNQVTAYGTVTLTAKGSSTGNAILTGLPFRARNTTGFPTSFSVGGWNMASLQSPITGVINENATLILLYDTGATGNSSIDETNFTDTTYLRFSVTYQIQ